MEEHFEDHREQGEELAHARPFDVHTWSNHPEANVFVNGIYDRHFAGRKRDIKRTHVKVVLLDLYVAWTEDPAQKIVFSRNKNDYKARSRYNKLHISSLTIEVVDTLEEAELVETKLGFYDRRKGGQGRKSRMWPTERLIKHFREARFSPLDIRPLATRTAVILRKNDDDGHTKDIEYEDTDATREMEAMLGRYNTLLRRTFIDIPILEDFGRLNNEADRKQGKAVSQRDKFIRRIFNRGSFECGGRFFGGWWQNCPKEWRSHIFIDDKPTNELDFSGLHIVMAYAKKGIVYWDAVRSDPYEIEDIPFLQDSVQRRNVAKSLMLVLLNANDRKKAFGAFRREASVGTPEKKFKDDQLEIIYGALAKKHPEIVEFFHSDAGIQLMNLDSKITAKILDTFTERNVPVLTIHDSYIVQAGNEGWLEELMKQSYEEILGVPLILPKQEKDAMQPIKEVEERIKDIENKLMAWMPYAEVKQHFDNLHERYQIIAKPIRSERYKHNLSEFTKWKKEELHI
jgi:hypothetical protein